MAQRYPQDNYINLGPLTARYWQRGDKGSPVILIHGLGASADIWMHNVDALARRHRVYVPDVVGFGKTDKPDTEYTAALFSTFISDFMRALNIEQPTLIGNSLGGGIALQYALLYPERVDKLVLVDSAGFGFDAPISLRLVSLPIVGELLTRPGRFEAYFYFRHAVHDPAVLTREFVDTYQEIHSLPGNQEALLKVIRSVLSFRGGKTEMLGPVMNNLHRITNPTLILWGKHDRVLPLKHAAVGKEKIPNAELYVFDDCGHMPQYERPDEFNRVVEEFLSE
ncbi:MAG: alpha/beta fold hydrolase [Deltaproteobacteria bacterium]|nr:alpha/beta fold hydrolase [Deltaproteobacteria bacterium]MBN2688568.1 alpha/beta fold hydrolase [Deltaproteobacteria bacterium]